MMKKRKIENYDDILSLKRTEIVKIPQKDSIHRKNSISTLEHHDISSVNRNNSISILGNYDISSVHRNSISILGHHNITPKRFFHSVTIKMFLLR